MPREQGLALASIAIGGVVLALKYTAYAITGSVALYSDALESVVNVAAAVAAFVAIRVSFRPADRDHPYGHTKAEYFSSVFEGALIVVAALLVLHEAYGALRVPREIEAPALGLLVNGLATAINAAWCSVLIRQGRRHRSPALIADGRHLLADVISSVGVIAGIALATTTGWSILDPLLAVAVAINILWSGWGLMKESVGGLMDVSPSPEVLDRLRGVISDQGAGAIEAHDLRSRFAGRTMFVDFHLVVPGEMTVSEAHVICDRIEDALRREFQDAVVTIHVEPQEKAKHSGIVVLSP